MLIFSFKALSSRCYSKYTKTREMGNLQFSPQPSEVDRTAVERGKVTCPSHTQDRELNSDTRVPESSFLCHPASSTFLTWNPPFSSFPSDPFLDTLLFHLSPGAAPGSVVCTVLPCMCLTCVMSWFLLFADNLPSALDQPVLYMYCLIYSHNIRIM